MSNLALNCNKYVMLKVNVIFVFGIVTLTICKIFIVVRVMNGMMIMMMMMKIMMIIMMVILILKGHFDYKMKISYQSVR